MTWANVPIIDNTGNTSVFVSAGPIVVEKSGNDADEIDFNNVFASAAWIFTTTDPITFTSITRNDPV